MLAELDTTAVAGALARLLERPEDDVEAYFEVEDVVTLHPEGAVPGTTHRREEGLAVRLRRGDEVWSASADHIDGDVFADSLAQVVRSRSPVRGRRPSLAVDRRQPPVAESVERLATFARDLERELRDRRVGFPYRLELSLHRRVVRTVGSSVAAPAQEVRFASVVVEMPWRRLGALLPELDGDGAAGLASRLAASFRCRESTPVERRDAVVVLGPRAAAVLLHEAVAHALEADTLAMSGRVEASLGFALGSEALRVVDDPAGAPPGLVRTHDDEGAPTLRRWLLRGGRIEQPLADRRWADRVPALQPGAGRRSDRHGVPGPRSYFLRLLPGEADDEELLGAASGGIFVADASRGSLDPLTGSFSLRFPHARLIDSDGRGRRVGGGHLRGRVGDLLGRIAAVGSRVESSGAGWCAKNGSRMPVWAEAPSLLVERAEVAP